MAKVVLTPEADRQMQKLPRVIRYRLHDVVDRLERWPDTSGAKPLRHGLKGHYRIRTGDFRVMFRVVADEVWIVRIEHRKGKAKPPARLGRGQQCEVAPGADPQAPA